MLTLNDSQPPSTQLGSQTSALADDVSQSRRGIHCCRSSSGSQSNIGSKIYRRKNPFELLPEQLTGHVCSPSLFQRRTPEGSPLSRSFNWSIDQLAELFPVDFDEEQPSSEQPEESYFPCEDEAQEAIDRFFSSKEIVPSPCESPSKVKSSTLGAEGFGVNKGGQPERELETATVCCQTTFTVPPQVDLTSILGDYFTFDVARKKGSSA
ncbi:hypothetical protein MRX96_043185 [Rhipicephalus microplus]